MKIESPNNIDVLLHCYTSRSEHERYDAPAVKEAFDEFESLGAIERVDGVNTFKTTSLGEAWAMALCNVRMPKRVYVDENGSILSRFEK